MNAPLILGNDLRKMPDSVLDIVANKDLIAINQDKLCKPCKRIRRGFVDVLAKPLADGSTAVCFFNRGKLPRIRSIQLDNLAKDSYIGFKLADKYTVKELWTKEETLVVDTLRAKLQGNSVKIYIVKTC